MGLKRGETLLVVTDVPTREIGETLFQGGTDAGANAMLMVIQPTGKNGAEPPDAVAAAMKQADVVVCPTKFSVTHTQARMEAAKAGARMLVNQSPEPFSNILLSLFEDVVAVGGSYAAVAHPLAILAVVATFLGLFALLARRIYRRLRRDSAPPRNSSACNLP